MTAEWHHYHNARYKKDKIGYYHCYTQGGCPGSFIEVDELEKRVANLFKNYQFSNEFIDLVIQKVKDILNESRKNLKYQRQTIINQRKAIEKDRNKLEDLLVKGVIGRDVYQRQHQKLETQIVNLDSQLSTLENQQQIDVSLIEEVLAFSRDIYKTYLEAPSYLKKHYLRFFFEGVYIEDKKIAKVVETPLFCALRRHNHIIIKNTLLPSHEVDITPQFEAIFATFQNPSYIGELRQRWFEIKKLQQDPTMVHQAI